MRANVIVGILLIMLGVFVLAGKTLSLTTKEEVADIGPIEIQKETTKSIPLSPILGALALAGGIALIVVGRTR